jgi:uncharacterized protein
MTVPIEAWPEEVFSIPRSGDRHFLYAPLRHCVADVNADAVNAVARYLDKGIASLSETEKAVVGSLEKAGFFAGPAPRPPIFPKDYVFRPHEVTLFLTSRCNLRCRYCYADAGHKAVDMPWETAKAAIDLVSRNAGLLGQRAFRVGFHGGGEPTVAWRMMTRCVEYALERADAMGLEAEICAATNGLIGESQREYISRHFKSVNVSLDGPADIQDRNRPKAGGGGSYPEVSETLRHFSESGLHFGVRSTITAESVERLREIVETLHAEFDLAYLHLEPVWECGRCLTSGERPPDDGSFVRNFLEAARRGRELGIDVTYSGARLDMLTSKFCAAPGDGFSVLPEGGVSSCFEVTEADDPRAAVFHYGRYDPESEAFSFDEDRLAALAELSVENIDFCGDCFCKWHCAGDCLAKALGESGSGAHNGSSRCEINRALTLAGLEELVGSRGSKEATGG